MILCLDIGGSWIKSALARSVDDIEFIDRRPTPRDDFDMFARVLEELLAAIPERPSRIAVSMTGVVEPQTGIITCANIPCIDQRRLGNDLAMRLGLPVLIANDADCFVLAEAGRGAGRGYAIVFGIILGSGVGGGLVANGRLVNAAGGYAGEWGHGPVVARLAGDPPVELPHFECGCGLRGCVNTIGGARGMERLHTYLHGEERQSAAIVDAWEAGDEKARKTIDLYVDLISSPLSLAINITGADVVPAGGGLANSERLLMEIDRTVRQRILRRFDRPLVVRAGCDMEPGLVGAALLGLRESGDA